MIEQFIHYLQYEKRYSTHTLAAYRTDLLQFASFFKKQYGLEKWSEAEAFHLRSWIFDLVDQELTKRSINRKICSLRSFFEFLVREEILEKNPAIEIRAIKTGRTLPEVVPMKVMIDFLNRPPQDSDWKNWRDFILIGFLYETGMRRAELGGLKWKDLDLLQDRVIVTGKGNKQRYIPLRSRFSGFISEYEKVMAAASVGKSEYVILTDRGLPVYPKWIYNRVRRLLLPYTDGEKLSPHTLRHSIATHLLMQGADIQIIKEFLGHSSLAATEIYTHNSIERLKKTYQKALPDLDHIH